MSQVLKAVILLSHSEETRRRQGEKEISEILERQPPISELKALEHLSNAAPIVKKLDPRIDTIWERAVTVRPGDEEIYAIWFRIKFTEKNWKAAQKVGLPLLSHHEDVKRTYLFSHRMLQAAMLYMKKFPEKREPFFWNIVMCELAGTATTSSETDRKILRPLAFGFLSRAILEAESGDRSVGV